MTDYGEAYSAKDSDGNVIRVGDLIVYAVRVGNGSALRKGVVERVLFQKLDWNERPIFKLQVRVRMPQWNGTECVRLVTIQNLENVLVWRGQQ